jgi:hypothetical protein
MDALLARLEILRFDAELIAHLLSLQGICDLVPGLRVGDFKEAPLNRLERGVVEGFQVLLLWTPGVSVDKLNDEEVLCGKLTIVEVGV